MMKGEKDQNLIVSCIFLSFVWVDLSKVYGNEINNDKNGKNNKYKNKSIV